MKKTFIFTFIIFFLFFSGTLFASNKFISATDTNILYAFGRQSKMINENELTMLLVGVDDEGVDNNTQGRTDTIILLKMNFITSKIDVLSIPRDSRVSIGGNLDKINHAHSYGGMDLLLRTFRENFGIDIDYYVKVDFDAVKDIVDAIGGIDLDVPMPIVVPSLDVYLEEGRQHLNGNEALMFVRFRDGYENGDIGRIQSQQYFVKEFIKQLAKPKNIVRLPALINSYYANVDTNIKLSYMLKIAPVLSSIKSSNIETHILPGYGEYIGDTSYWLINWQEANTLLYNVFEDNLIR